MKKILNQNYGKYLAYLALLIGVGLRIAVYIENRNLFQDEANIARNIYERSFLQLTLPLSYRQYAPPLFLWGLKVLTGIFGFSEYVFKLIPLLSGIGSLILTYLLLRRYSVKHVIWYPLFILSTGFIYIRYATELKQYSSDMFIALGLIYMALSIDPKFISTIRLILIWVCISSFAIWGSMPSVFILPGVWLYYFILFYRSHDYKKIYGLTLIAVIWFIQFLFYYQVILKPQIQSDYLQTFHKENFLLPFPKSIDELRYNWGVILNVFEGATGDWFYAIKFHLLLIVIAFYYSLRQRASSVILLLIPIVLLLLAVLLHQYALTLRIVLFILPLLLILIGIGFEQIFAFRHLRLPLLGLSFICLYQFSDIKCFYEPIRVEQITDGMDFLVREHITASQLYIHPLAFPAYTYYTQISPRKDRWAIISNGKELNYHNYYYYILSTIKGKTAILYGPTNPKEVSGHQKRVNECLTTLKHYSGISCQAYIYSPQ